MWNYKRKNEGKEKEAKEVHEWKYKICKKRSDDVEVIKIRIKTGITEKERERGRERGKGGEYKEVRLTDESALTMKRGTRKLRIRRGIKKKQKKRMRRGW